MGYMFSHWTEAFQYRQAAASSVAKTLLAKNPSLIQDEESPSNFTVTSQVIQQVGAIWLVLRHFHCFMTVSPPQSSGLVECTEGIIKTQLAKFVEILQIPWLKALLLVLLDVRSMFFKTHKL